ncbi:MAG: nucleoside phosphorylase [Candidatus Promineofilum sp.]|nr:nucleoside phosphorylase [Promineifilum sp.]
MTTNYLPITGLPAGGVSPSVIVCGDPERADRIAARLADSVLLSHKREYRAHLGRYGDASITVCSHGIGAPGAAVAFEELIAAGARRIIRVGTCGGLQPDIQPGCLVVATAAVQNTGYGREVTPDGYPAVAALDLTYQLGKVVDETGPANGLASRRGIVLTRDAFYAGVAAPAAPDYQEMSRANVLAVEMECSALFLVGGLRNVATAAILVTDGNVLETRESMDSYSPRNEVVQRAIDVAALCALETLKNIA